MAEVAKNPVEIDEESKKQRTRSPAYPYCNLETAITRAREFHKEERSNPANISIAGKHWGYKENSSGAYQTAAALISFGLMTDEGTGDKRKLKLTPAALRILLDADPNSTERARLIREAALSPKIHQELWKRWGKDLPSVHSLKNTLIFDWKPPFNENSVDGFIKEYKDTIKFAQLLGSDIVTPEAQTNADDEGSEVRYVPEIGDYVQWEKPNGDLGLPEPKKVRGFSPDGEWAYIESQHGAVPTRELIPEAAPPETPAKPGTGKRTQPPPKAYMQEFVVPLSDGAKAVFQWPTTLSAEDIDDLKDSLKILERKITRSASAKEQSNVSEEN
jgi:hypothetical protein